MPREPDPNQDYREIDLDKLWRVVSTHIPALISLVEPIVPPAPADPHKDQA